MKEMHGTVGKEEEEEIFRKGSRVEVTSTEEGFTGAWYVATVLATPSSSSSSSESPPSKKRSKPGNRQTTQLYLVEYDNLLNEDDPLKPLSEYVDISFIRPVQPTADGDEGRYGFQVNDVVDVNLRDGLWTGVVKRVVDGGSKFLVHFDNPPNEVECSGSDIRIHLDWVDRKWVRPNKQETIQSKDEVHTKKKRGRPQKSSSKFPKGSKDESSGKAFEVDKLESGARDVTNVINDERPSQIFDERALLSWFDGMKSTTPINNGVSNGRVILVNTESSVRKNHTATRPPSPAVFVNNENIEESQNMPFEKSSTVWKTIESMEVFQKTPQRPHFSPLFRCREDSREGLAVGHMITFANLVEKTLTLHVSHPQSVIESILETLKELEDHGFDAEPILNRLTELQTFKNKMGQLEDSFKEAEDEMTKLNEEKKELEELIDKVEKKMKQIKEKLGAAASMKESKVKQINVLKSKVNFFADSLESTKSDFERIAASPL